VTRDVLGVLLAERLEFVSGRRVQIASRDVVGDGRLVDARPFVRRIRRTLAPCATALRERTPATAPAPPLICAITVVPALATGRTAITAVPTLTTRRPTITVVPTLTTGRSPVTVVPTLTTGRTTITVVPTLTTRGTVARAVAAIGVSSSGITAGRTAARFTVTINRATSGRTTVTRTLVVIATRTALFLFRHAAPCSLGL
jgi:hypothetical protein